MLDERLAARAHVWDAAGALPADLVDTVLQRGWLKATADLSELEFGELCEEAGAADASLRSLLTVGNMVAATLLRWGTD